MAIEGLSHELMQWILGHAEAAGSLTPEGLEAFRTQGQDPSITYTPDHRTLQVVTLAAAAAEPQDTHYEEIRQRALEMGQRVNTAPTVTVPGYLRESPETLIVPPGHRTHPGQIEWDAEQFDYHLWAMSDEAHHAVHFLRDQPQDTLLVIGGFQAFNLADDRIERIVRLDWDARQIAHDALFSGLFMISEGPQAMAENFLRIARSSSREPPYEAMVRALERAEGEGRLPAGRALFLRQLVGRSDALSLRPFVNRYHLHFEHILKEGPRHALDQANFDWLLDPEQYQTVRRMYREGRIVSFQGNVYDPMTMQDVGRYLTATGHRVSTFYLSDPQDLVHMTTPSSQNFEGLGVTLRNLPRYPDAVLQWTFNGGVPLMMDTYRDGLLPTMDFVHDDPLDPRHYAYMEIPLERVFEFFPTLPTDRPGDFAKHMQRSRHRPINYYYTRLHDMIRSGGILVDGKLTIAQLTPPATSLPAFGAANVYRWMLRWRNDGASQKYLSQQLALAQSQGGPEACQELCRQIDTGLDPEKRGRFRDMLFVAEETVLKAEVFPETTFDPRPRSVRRARLARGIPTVKTRFEDLHTRRTEARK